MFDSFIEKQQKLFNNLKKIVSRDICLTYPDFNSVIETYTDASKNQLHLEYKKCSSYMYHVDFLHLNVRNLHLNVRNLHLNVGFQLLHVGFQLFHVGPTCYM